MHRTVIIFMVLEVLGNGAVDSRIIRNASASDHHHFHGFGSGLSSFSCLWKKLGGGRVASES